MFNHKCLRYIAGFHPSRIDEHRDIRANHLIREQSGDCMQLLRKKGFRGLFALRSVDLPGLRLALARPSSTAARSGMLLDQQVRAAYSERGHGLLNASFIVANTHVHHFCSTLGVRFVPLSGNWLSPLGSLRRQDYG